MCWQAQTISDLLLSKQLLCFKILSFLSKHKLHLFHHEVCQGVQEGDFFSKEAANQLNQMPDDQALEHVNRARQVGWGLVGITRSDAARDR